MARLLAAALVLAVAGCTATAGPDPDGGDGSPPSAAIRILHTVADVSSIDVLVDDTVVLRGVPLGAPSAFVPVRAGARALAFRPSGSALDVPAHVLPFTVGDSLTVLTIDSGTVLNPWVLTDTGGLVPSNRSKLRALHAAAEAPALDIWRTQPDYADPVTFMFPHNYLEVTPYVESDPGLWTVLVSTRRRNQQGIPALQDTVLLVPGFTIPGGESRTIVILDAAGGGLGYALINP